MVILDIGNDFKGQYDTVANTKLLNGVFTFTLCRIAQPEDFPEGSEDQAMWTGLFSAKLIDYKDYYFKLDGSMDRAGSISGNTANLFNDGYSIIGYSSSALNSWDPTTNQGKVISDNIDAILDIYEPLFDAPAPEGQDSSQYHAMDIHTLNEGYAGTEYALYLERTKNGYDITDNILCRLNYITGKSEKLLSTGLQGAYRLICFPDCFVLVETIHENMTVPENPMMHIYSWEMEPLGTCELNFPHAVAPQNLICGETANRIYLCAYYDGAPEYYIDKADFGNGTITYRELSYSNVDPAAAYQDMRDKIDAYQAELAALQEGN